ncbi:PREDICTED: 7-methylguanosine phosphate-specific 5'-nucleotidase-like [Amphimedon queenslandica]|uniref:5'-nucleotidase n=1 Tax=Amphimedon queenslandica TaxID=400682 RepID=A0A1X7U3T1_AMPQE|nr:PREDICTED: 7-methylguanosine phosphate-specific 5'-nucleotidase-like [Amphimedon queenslandica]XP_019856207.1 PREDICTED: 7-methylguanosine phosphate-specific 5'-nucleotidase-like [Amphimedon queenslandica]XP_019856208.1 PREDICTED: 7-methylguanosine phosphate-specific 5'-nucleotidase-like [Amphimedon queenslandica]|eukprot:XP_011406096.1 PREDICTED: 7-methylguanosine phosphate-specific 5'-nucleotidase-like [Amphimedon queenslandica]
MAAAAFVALKQLLEEPPVHCKDIESVIDCIGRMRTAGRHKLQVLSDFDYTLTYPHFNGKPVTTSHGVMESSGLLSKSFVEKALNLKAKYLPIEHCHERSLQEKTEAMEEWWRTVHHLITQQSVTKNMLVEMVKASDIFFRDHHDDMFRLLEVNDVPLTICSAGLADIILIALDATSYKEHANLSVVGNKMIYNEESVVTAFTEPVIHSYNKGLTSLTRYPQLVKKLKDRSNVIVIGDSQGDPFMINGLENIDNVIKIGFLNQKKEALLTVYEELYDIVITDPASSLFVPLSIMKAILTENS